MAISPNSIAEAIEIFIRREHKVPDNDHLFTRDAHLFESGFVDSLGFTQLLAFIESTFHLTFEDGYLFSEDFTTINGISKVAYECLSKSRCGASSTET